MHTYVVYMGASPEELDAKAIADAVEYLGPTRAKLLTDMVAVPTATVSDLNFIFGFVGITGRPFYAWMRRDRLAEFRDWMQASGVATDERGFVL